MNLGILGLKGHVGTILNGAKSLGNVDVVAVSEDDPALLNSYLKKGPQFEKAQGYENWRHLLEHSMLDVCCVAGENGERCEQLLALFERGIHVVAEKPLVTTLEDLERVRAAFAKSKSQLSMLLELRYQPKNVRVRESILRGDIGEVCQVTAQKSYRWGSRAEWFRKYERLGGIIPYIGIHSTDTISWVTGLDFTHVAAVQSNIGHPEMGETECQASVLGQLSNGASATVRLDYLRPPNAPTHGDDRLRVAGTKGIIEVNDSEDAVTLISNDKIERIPFGSTENLFVEFAKFIQGGPPPRISAADCFRSTEIVLRARQAAQEKKLVEIPAPRPVRM